MAELLIKWALLCSECEKFIAMKAGQKFPSECPHCGSIFEKKKYIGEEVKSEDGEQTFLPPMEKYLEKLKDKL